MTDYERFISAKHLAAPDVGFEPGTHVATLAPFQALVVDWAIRKGRAALFLDTGLGKTRCQLEWARQVAGHTGEPVLILAPLAVAQQTVREGAANGIAVAYAKSQEEVGANALVITNYERIGKFDHSTWGGVVLDESGILKSYSGSLKNEINESFAATPFRLACSATPAPNDHLELGNHSDFLGVMHSHEMIARWFINDTSEFGKYTLKGHAVESFWDWVSSWAALAGVPSDLGSDFADAGYVLPELITSVHVVDVDVTVGAKEGFLFRIVDLSATTIHEERRKTATARAAAIAELVAAEPHEQWLIWCDTDYEADALTDAIPSAVEVRGSDSLEIKESRLAAFAEGTARIMVTKPKIAGFGLNLQRVARVAFVGATFSFESYYQAIRRCWRFGQRRPVHVHVAMAETETPVWDVLQRKATAFVSMQAQMVKSARRRRNGGVEPGQYRPGAKLVVPAWLTTEERQ